MSSSDRRVDNLIGPFYLFNRGAGSTRKDGRGEEGVKRLDNEEEDSNVTRIRQRHTDSDSEPTRRTPRELSIVFR